MCCVFVRVPFSAWVTRKPQALGVIFWGGKGWDSHTHAEDISKAGKYLG